MKHPDKLEDCKVVVSRKPCSICAKLLVQSNVAIILYMPLEPELEIEDDLKDVEILLRISRVAQSIFFPKVPKEVIMAADKNKTLESGKWFEPRSLSRLCGLIVRVRVVSKRTVVGDIDRRFDNLSGSHHQSHGNTLESKRKKIKEDLRQKYRNETWFEEVKEFLPWRAFEKEMKTQVERDFDSLMEWMAMLIAQSSESSFEWIMDTSEDRLTF